MRKDDRSSINPFTGKKHFDIVDDDKFLNECYREYYSILNRSQIADMTPQGQLVKKVAVKLISAVERYLAEIGRSDYTENYYDWEFHLVVDDTVNAFCIPGGKIVMYSGMFSVADSEDKIAFILGHEMAHALLDHGRTRVSAQNAKNTITTATWLGSIALDLVGLGELGSATRAVTNVASIGSEFFLMNPWGRDHELEADKLGMMIIHLAGYDIKPIPSFWSQMSMHGSNNHDFFSTHPSDDKRIAVMRESILEIYNTESLYSKPLLAQTPKAKEEFKNKGNCPECGYIVDSDAKFCTNCGFKLDMYCMNCGAEIEKDANFCTNCGTRL